MLLGTGDKTEMATRAVSRVAGSINNSVRPSTALNGLVPSKRTCAKGGMYVRISLKKVGAVKET